MKRLGIAAPPLIARLAGDPQGAVRTFAIQSRVRHYRRTSDGECEFAARAIAPVTSLFRETQQMRVLGRNPALDFELLCRPEARIRHRDSLLRGEKEKGRCSRASIIR